MQSYEYRESDVWVVWVYVLVLAPSICTRCRWKTEGSDEDGEGDELVSGVAWRSLQKTVQYRLLVVPVHYSTSVMV